VSRRRQVPNGKKRPRGWGQRVVPVRMIVKRRAHDRRALARAHTTKEGR
jgi:hypothetical protein